MTVLDQISTTYELAKATVTRVPEILLDAIPPEALYPEWSSNLLKRDSSDSVQQWTSEGLLRSIHSWLVRTSQHTVLIDTATGNGKSRTGFPVLDHLQEPYLERLKAAGAVPEEIDYVLHTHLHVDHVGWNTQLIDGRWVPTFPRAKHLFPVQELDFYTNPANREDWRYQIYLDSILPIIESGQAQPVGPDGAEVLDGFTFVPTFGHSAGHMSILFRADGEEAIFAGDVMHHPLQVYFPQLNSIYCESAEKARRSREWVLQFAAERGAFYFSSHFPETSAGRITTGMDGFEWRYL